MATHPDPKKNHLLAALPADEWARWLPSLEPVDMPLGEVLYESGMAMTHVRYTQALITQMAQTAVCNRHHSLDQQLCRWLLLSLDRLQAPELVMTQELIANMLGVRREGVTEAAANLQRAGLIQYRRGHITVVDRKGLERRTCECYAVVRKEYERLLLAESSGTK